MDYQKRNIRKNKLSIVVDEIFVVILDIKIYKKYKFADRKNGDFVENDNQIYEIIFFTTID